MTNPKMLHQVYKQTTCKDCAFSRTRDQENNSIQLVCMYNPPQAYPAPTQTVLGGQAIGVLSVRPSVNQNDFCAFGLDRPGDWK